MYLNIHMHTYIYIYISTYFHVIQQLWTQLAKRRRPMCWPEEYLEECLTRKMDKDEDIVKPRTLSVSANFNAYRGVYLVEKILC